MSVAWQNSGRALHLPMLVIRALHMVVWLFPGRLNP